MIFLLFIIFLPEVHLDHQDPCPSGSCTPQLGDLLVGRGAQLSASSTCGQDGPQNYCIIGYLEGQEKCFTCDSQLPYDRYSNPTSHRIENIITNFDLERKLKWWQSENGVHHVSIQLDLETLFKFSHLVLTFKSFRPAAMLVERSKDFGRTWKVFRYFAKDCPLHFPLVSAEPARSIDDVVCDSRYSGTEPSTDGELVLKVLDPVFKIENLYAPNIQDLITLTNIRVNFTHLFTLGDTLLSRRRRNLQDKYYYSVYNMVVQGSCFCNGHGSQCVPVAGGRGDIFTQPGMVHGQCVCQHNTAGENCERCQDFHHDSPWRPGGEKATNICRRCNCHGHSYSCHFDAARYKATRGLSGGVCNDCGHNRTGPQCEQCRPFLYQDPQRAKDDPHACIPCDCDPAGSRNGGLCDALSGQCVCKENVEGQRCDRCKHGFFNLRQDDPVGCRACRCHPLGSVGSCDQLTGSCECDQMASGQLCDQCLPGFWGLGNSVFRCSPCNCDIGGSHGNTCSPEDGQCHCLPNMIGRRCADPAPGYFLPSLNYFLFEAELAAPLPGRSSSTFPPPYSPAPVSPPSSSSSLNPGVLPQCEHYFRERGFETKFQNGRVVWVHHRARQRRQGQQQATIPLEPSNTLQIIPHQRVAHQPVTWTGLGLVRVLEGVGLRFTVDNLPSSMDYLLLIHYELESASDWLASVSIITVSPGDGGCNSNPTGSKTLILLGNTRRGILESPVCLNAASRYFVDIFFYKQPGSDSSHILIDSMSLIHKTEPVHDVCSQSDLNAYRQYRCVGLAVELNPQELLPNVCEGLIMSLSAQIHNGAVLCRCNVIGSVGTTCSKLDGFCECKPNVIGHCCDSCAPMTFGFGPEGCKRCECDPRGSVSELCDQVRGQCVCHSEVTGRRCDGCRTGFWGFPFCQPCDCNGRSEVCDRDTGECVNCREHTTGPTCDRCVEGYYGDPVSRESCQPCFCPDVLSSGRFFATSCQRDPQSLSLTCNCWEGHTGVRCDKCSPGFYGDLTLPGAVCKECPCNNNIDPEDRYSCESTTGECLRCLHNTMGLHCQKCKPGYYGNALARDCKACGCNPEGTKWPSCDSETGDCICQIGVTGIFCDECAPDFDTLFPTCKACHPCNALWTEIITDVQRAAERMRTFIPHNHLKLTGNRHLQEMIDMHTTLDSLANLIGVSASNVENVEKLFVKFRKLKNVIDPNVILINTSPLLNTEIDSSHLEFNNLMKNLKEKLNNVPTDEENDQLEELLDKIQKLHEVFMSDEKRVRNASKAVEDSMDTRQAVKSKLSTCSSTGDLGSLVKKVKELSVVQLNQKVCGDPDWEDCLGCGGALCHLDLGKRMCGGPNCNGAVPVSERASEAAEKLRNQLIKLPSRLQDSNNKINNANQMAQDTKSLAKDLQDQITSHTNTCGEEKNKIRGLIQLVKNYLMGDMVSPDDIKKMARAVLKIQLPLSPAQIRSMINDINNLLTNVTKFSDGLKNVDTQAEAAQDMQQKARELKEHTRNIDVKKIVQNIYEAQKARDKANNNLETASRDKDETKDRIQDTEDLLDDIEAKLTNESEDLLKELRAVKNKTQKNREAVRDAREAAETAVNMTADAEMELDDVIKLFEAFKQKQQNQEFEGVAADQLKNIIAEAEEMERHVEDKLRQIQDVEQKIEQLLQRRNQKAAEVSSLLQEVEFIQQNITTQTEEYDKCT